MELQELRVFYYRLPELKSISRKLHRWNEVACNVGLTERQEKRVEKLEAQAKELADFMGFGVYFQTDPRGCALHLIPKDWDAKQAQRDYYPGGLAIY